MRPTATLLAVLALALVAGACETSSSPEAGTRGACLDRPGVQRPSDGTLPCELLPPGR